MTRIDGSDGAVTVHYATADGTAKEGTDYLATSGDLAFNAGETTKTFTITTLDDYNALGDKSFSVVLSAPSLGTTLGAPSTSSVTILDNHPGRFQFSVATVTVNEGKPATLTVTRTAGSDGLVTVGFATANGSAVAGVDFVATSGTLTFQPGEPVKTVAIATLDDGRVAGNKTFSVMLGAPGMGATLGDPSAASVIIVDGQPGSLRFSASTAPVKEGQIATLIVTRSGGSTASSRSITPPPTPRARRASIT